MKTLQAIDPDNIDSISVLKDKTAIDRFGKKGKDGVIIVITKSNKQLTINSDFVIKHNIELAENTSPVNSIVIINGKEPIYEIDGIESTKKEALKIKNSKIKKITALRGEPAIKKIW